MNIDTTNINSVTRTSSASYNANRTPGNIVPINPNITFEIAAPITQPTNDEITEAVDFVNNFVQQSNRNLEFAIAESSGRVVITVREAETGNIIRQIPPEEVLALSELINANLNNVSTPLGVLISDKV
jgi:uncharacterized FlaG/YvyC family protein